MGEQWERLTDEQIDRDGYVPSSLGETDRLRVPGGWLYRTRMWTNNDPHVSIGMTFVPDPACDSMVTADGRCRCGTGEHNTNGGR